MTRLPVLTRRQLVRRLEQRHGFRVVRQTGDHYLLAKGGRLVSIPDRQQISAGLMATILKQAGLRKEEF